MIRPLPVTPSLDRRGFLKVMGGVMAASALLPLAGCGDGGQGGDSTASSDGGVKTDTHGLSEDAPMVVDKDAGAIYYLAQVNGEYFTMPTRHGIVYKAGSNGEKAVLRGLGDEKELYKAMDGLGWAHGDNLTAEDMKAAPGEGKAIEGDQLDITIAWDGHDPIPFGDAIKASDGAFKADWRFGGNLKSAEKNNTGCVVCLDSCPTGIISDAAYPTGTFNNGTTTFTGNSEVLPADGTAIYVTFKKAQ